jgi:siroheme synthase-like protein
MSWTYPVFLDLRGKQVLVIGEGPLAEEKIRGLVRAGALVVTMNAAEWTPESLDGVFLMVSATGDRAFNATVFEEAERRGVLCNSLDDPPHCRFIYPSIHRQGDLTIAVSTNGKCPAIAVRIREQLEQQYGPEYADFLEMAGALRKRIAEQIPDFGERRAFWYDLVDSVMNQHA